MAFSCFKKSPDWEEFSSFFVITSVFNPCNFSSRYKLYQEFALHMESLGVQLITIEAIFPSLNQHNFQVTSSQNPNHIQIHSNSVYWIKENLINIAAKRLPPHAKYICWLDSDITFLKKDWVSETIRELKTKGVVQIFKKGNFLGPEKQILRTDYSFGYSVLNGKIIDQNRYEEWYPHPGYGWAMKLSTFMEIGGLPEYDIVGSGDLHFAFSLINKISNALEDQLHPEFRSFVLSQSAETFRKLSEICKREGGKQIVGFVNVNINHNWHGSRKDRQYVDRWKILIAHKFNFQRDVVKNSEGLLEFREHMSALQEDILTHFSIRNEDGNECKQDDLDVVTKKPKSVAPRVVTTRYNDDNERRRRQQQDMLYFQSYQDTPRYYDDEPCIPDPDYGGCLPPPDGHYCPPNHDNHHHDHSHSSNYPDAGHYSSIHTSSHY